MTCTKYLSLSPSHSPLHLEADPIEKEILVDISQWSSSEKLSFSIPHNLHNLRHAAPAFRACPQPLITV